MNNTNNISLKQFAIDHNMQDVYAEYSAAVADIRASTAAEGLPEFIADWRCELIRGEYPNLFPELFEENDENRIDTYSDIFDLEEDDTEPVVYTDDLYVAVSCDIEEIVIV